MYRLTVGPVGDLVAATLAALDGQLGEGCSLLVKGSRSARMERVVAALCDEPAGAGAH